MLYRTIEGLVRVAAIANAGADLCVGRKDRSGSEANRQNDSSDSEEGFVIGHGFS